jgi:uncharacterized protein (TIGR00251 family)
VTESLRVTPVNGGVRFAVHVQPRASRNELAGTHGDAIKVRLTAPPADGAANDALVRLLAKAFTVPARAVRIVSGAHARAKVIEVDGIAADDVRRLLTTSGDD